MFSKSTSQNLTAGKKPMGFGKGRLLQVAEQPLVNNGVMSLDVVYLFMIKIIYV